MAAAHERTLRGCGVLLRLQQEQKARLAFLKGKFTAALTPHERLEASRLPKDISYVHRRLTTKRRVYSRLYTKSLIKLALRGVDLPNSSNVSPLSASEPLTLEQRILNPALPGPHSFVYSGAVHSTMHVVTEACAEETRDRQQTPFDSYRAKL